MDKPDLNIENKIIITLRSIINKKYINSYLLSEILSIPTFSEIESQVKNINPLKIYKVIDQINNLFGSKLKKELYGKLHEIDKKINKIWPEGKDERKLVETIWKLLLHSEDKEIRNKIVGFVDCNSMTLSKAALNVFTRINCSERVLISQIFFNKWKNNPLVLDSWFFFKASIEIDDNQKSIENLFNNKYFDFKSPNTLRSILNGYVTRNSFFHSIDGSGYKYIAKKIIYFDKSNPIIISRFLKVFTNFRRYENPHKTNMLKVLNEIKEKELSSNTREVIDAIL